MDKDITAGIMLFLVGLQVWHWLTVLLASTALTTAVGCWVRRCLHGRGRASERSE